MAQPTPKKKQVSPPKFVTGKSRPELLTSSRAEATRSGRAPLPMLGALIGLLAVAVAWWQMYDDSRIGLYVLGGYREPVFGGLVGATWLSLTALWLAWMHPGRAAVWRFVLVHASLIFTVLLLEAVAMFGLVDYTQALEGDTKEPRAVAAANGIRSQTRANVDVRGETHADLVALLGASGESIEYHLRTDDYGLRNPTTRKNPEVVCLGDSILVAGLVSEADMMTELLCKQLDLSVLNCSEVGSSPQEEYLRFEATGLVPSNRLFVQFLFEGNDLSDSRTFREWRAGQRIAWPASGFAKTMLHLLKWPTAKTLPGSRASFRGTDGAVDVCFLYDARQQAVSRDELEPVSRFLVETRDQIHANSGRYAVCFVPSKLSTVEAHCDFDAEFALDRDSDRLRYFARGIEQACAAADVPFLDLLPALRSAAAAGKLPFFPADTHLNAFGHSVMADAVAEWLQPMLPKR